MRLSKPRIAPVEPADWTDEQKILLEPMAAQRPVLNIFKTLARDPAALKAFLGWGSYVLSRKNALPAREREIAVLRTGWLCRSGYEWTQHVPIGRRAGLTDAEITAIKVGAAGEDWSEADRAILTASDELHADHFISNGTWAALKAHFSDKQCMDLVFTVGQYTQVSMILNSFGVQLDPGQTLDPDLDGR
jgi:4-carboxymuconolactone decarboxylase